MNYLCFLFAFYSGPQIIKIPYCEVHLFQVHGMTVCLRWGH